MKKLLSVLLCVTMLLGVCAMLTACGGGSTLTLNVYNWGEYISDGSEGSLDTIKAFEAWYQENYGQKIKVNYTTFASNEDMYNKLSSGAVSYDVIIPSDYMIAKMIEEGMLLPLNFDNIPNYENIDQNFRGLNYDPEDKYTVPYSYGVVGIIYNANVVDEADAQGWDLLWNEKYAGQILQFNNPRDAFGTAQYKLGLDVNSSDKAQWDQAYEELKKQEPLVQKYVMDEWICSSTIPSAPTTSSTPCASRRAARTRSWRRSSSTICSPRSPPSPTPSISTTPAPTPSFTTTRTIRTRWAKRPWRSCTWTWKTSRSSTISTAS